MLNLDKMSQALDESLAKETTESLNTFLDKTRDGMEEITIYKFQLDLIIDALKLTSRIHNSKERETCFDRQVVKALAYANNALNGEKDTRIKQP